MERIIKEIQELKQSGLLVSYELFKSSVQISNGNASASGNSVFLPGQVSPTLAVVVFAVSPREGVFKGSLMKFCLTVNSKYPSCPPYLQCEKPVFHPNISKRTGEVGLRLLSSSWSSQCSFLLIAKSVNDLFIHPELDEALNEEAVELYSTDSGKFYQCARDSLRHLNLVLHPTPSVQVPAISNAHIYHFENDENSNQKIEGNNDESNQKKKRNRSLSPDRGRPLVISAHRTKRQQRA